MRRLITALVLLTIFVGSGSATSFSPKNKDVTYTPKPPISLYNANLNSAVSGYKKSIFIRLEQLFDDRIKTNEDENPTLEELRARSKYISKKAKALGMKIAMVESREAIISVFSNREITKQLDSLYPIQKIIFKQNFLPPVIDFAQNSLLKKSDNILRSTKFVFKKVKKAKVVGNNYSWRNYFYFFITGQDADTKINLDSYINSASTPLSEAELIYWYKNIEKGYNKGLSFMENGLRSNFAELNRDFKGFLLFYILQDQGLIQPIEVAANKEEYIVKEDELRIGDELFELSDPSFSVDGYLERLNKMKARDAIY